MLSKFWRVSSSNSSKKIDHAEAKCTQMLKNQPKGPINSNVNISRIQKVLKW